MNSWCTWRHREGLRNVYTTAIRRALSPLRPGGSVTAEVHGCPRRRRTEHATHRAQGHPGGETREEKRLYRFPCLGMRGPPTSPLFASWPELHHKSLIVRSDRYTST